MLLGWRSRLRHLFYADSASSYCNLIDADVEDKGLQQTAAFLTSFIRYVCFVLFHFLAQLVATVRHGLFCRVLCVGSVDGGRTLCWRYCAVFGGWRAAPV